MWRRMGHGRDQRRFNEKIRVRGEKARPQKRVEMRVWLLRDCVRIKVRMGRQIFIKRGGGVRGAELRLLLILRRLAFIRPPPPHTHTPPAPPPPLASTLSLPRLCMTKFGRSVESGQHFHVCVHPSWKRERGGGGGEREREKGREGERGGCLGGWGKEGERGFAAGEGEKEGEEKDQRLFGFGSPVWIPKSRDWLHSRV